MSGSPRRTLIARVVLGLLLGVGAVTLGVPAAGADSGSGGGGGGGGGGGSPPPRRP
jgi:hypothetical protein